MSSFQHSSDPSVGRFDPLGVAGVLCLLVGVFVRAMTPVDTLPGWDFDPMVVPINMSGVGPAGSIMIDAVILLGAVLLLVREAMGGRRVSVWAGAALLAATVVVGWHGLANTTSVGDLRIGTAWLAAIGAGVALVHAGRDARLRGVVMGLLGAFVVVMAIRGAEQVYIDHPRTLADFEEHRAQFLLARGWEEGSTMVRQYERRLSQPDASGWFAMSNVYASLAAAGVTMFAGLLWCVVRKPRNESEGVTGRREVQTGIVVLCFLAACAALFFSDSKGGMMAAGAGVVSLVVFGFLRRFNEKRSTGETPVPRNAEGSRAARLAGAFAVLTVVGAIAMVVCRGVVGEKIGELSLLVRWFYMQGAVRIFGGHSLLGVGPEGFQAAYLLVRNPLSTEEVSSPHSVLLDWAAGLGVAGIVLGMLWLGWVWKAGAAATTPEHRSSDPDLRTQSGAQIRRLEDGLSVWQRHPETALAGAVVAVCLVVAFRLNPELWTLPRVIAEGKAGKVDAGVLAAGLLGMIAVVGAVWVMAARVIGRVVESTPAAVVAVSAGAVVLAVHAQIDVGATWVSSAAMVMAWIGLAAGPGSSPSKQGSDPASKAKTFKRAWLTPCVSLLALVVCVAAYVGVRPFDRTLIDSARMASPIAEMKPLVDELMAVPPYSPHPPPTSARQRELVGEVARVFSEYQLPLGPGQRIDSAGAAVAAYQQTAAGMAAASAVTLAELAERYPREWELRREAGRLALTAAASFRQFGAERPSAEMVRLAEGVTPGSGSAADPAIHPAGEWLWAATVYENLALMAPPSPSVASHPGSSSEVSRYWAEAEGALMKARELDPYALAPVVKLFELARMKGEAGDAEARKWAGVMLELDGLKRLDPEGAGLTSRERSEAESATGKP